MLVGGPIQAQSIIKETETHSVFKGVFLNVWSKLRALNPHSRQDAKSTTVYTAGIRGAEATETLIQPYWKGDLSQDAKFQQQLSKFSQAQELMDNGDLEAAAKAFNEFISQYGNSSLAPNALFAQSLSQAALGKKGKASKGIKQFIDDNPNHPLIADARELLQQLQ